METETKIVCLVGPSGVGKTSYMKRLMEKYHFTLPSVATTRQRRTDDDEHYRYVTEREFLEMINANAFLEWDKYLHYYYGTFVRDIEDAICKHSPGILLDLTPKGCQQVADAMSQAIIIAILPDNPAWLFERLVGRNSQPPEEIRSRTSLVKSYLDEMNSLTCVNKKIFAGFSPNTWDKTFGEIERAIFE